MAFRSLNRLRRVRELVTGLRKSWLRIRGGVDVPDSASISLTSRFRPSGRGAIKIGADTLIAFKTLIYTRDEFTGEDRPVRIGQRCFIGGGSIICPGVTIGDECIVAGGAVVDRDVPSRCIVGGNPARILREDIQVGRFGRMVGADENSRQMWR